MMGCSECSTLGAPPPNMILNLPPPPLPSFLLPKSSQAVLPGNNGSQPCFAAFMCEPSLSGHSDNSIEYIELPRNGQIGIEETWFFVLVSSLLGVLLLGVLFAILLIKCRDSYNCSFRDNNLKHQSTMDPYISHEPRSGTKTLPHHGFIVQNGTLTCTMPTATLMSNHHPNFSQPTVDSRLLWATLTPHGTTQHFVEPYPQDNHYEAVDYNRKAYQACVNDLNKSFNTVKKPNKTTFENNGFVDYDYEDPTPLIGNNVLDNDLDSGYQDYQEPQDLNQHMNNSQSRSSPMISSTASTLQRQRHLVSTPTRIINPNIPPLNSNPHLHYNPNHHYRSLNKNKQNNSNSSINTMSGTGTPINKRSATITRRVSDVANS